MGKSVRQQLDSASFSNIILTSTLPPYNLLEYGQEIVDAFARTSPSKTAFKITLIENGPALQHDNILHADRAFAEVTARHFMDLIESNRNPLLFSMQERSACIDTTGCIMNKYSSPITMSLSLIGSRTNIILHLLGSEMGIDQGQQLCYCH
ncbi:hypothetical protein BDB01DRAFT_831301 [Pilobolus umbonatus]|nr:hypothetical protein BDB01DRAFT_831301 [Pilobolus umbonatus]